MSVHAPATSTRERLLRAAQELIEEEGYGAASVVAIAGRAGLATGTLYRHFPSKAELIVELFRAVCDRELRAMRDAATAADTAVARLEAVFATFAERALRNPRLAWALIAEPVDPLVDGERLAYRRRYSELTELLLREALASGEVPRQDVPLTAAALVGGGGEALAGPLSPLASSAPADAEIVGALREFVRRAIGASAAASPVASRSGPR
jgi:AcrR family transcriptional regulator